MANFQKTRKGKVVKNECGKSVYLNSFIFMRSSVTRGGINNDGQLNTRTICERDSRMSLKETVVAFKTGSIYEGYFQSVGDFVFTAGWGVKTSAYS